MISLSSGRGKKGMASIIDAFMFITVIGLIAAGMFAYSGVNDDDALAKTAYDSFFDIKLRTSDMFIDTDSQNVMMCDMVAAHIASGEGVVKEYIESVLRTIIPPIYCFLFVFEYGGSVLTVGEKGNRLTSGYSSDIMITGGGMMRASLSIY